MFNKVHNKYSKKYCHLFVFIIAITMSKSIYAHHGGVSTAFGPGSPIETASPITLPRGTFLLFEKVEWVPFEQQGNAEPENIDYFAFFNTLFGYGFTDAFSLYLNLPAAVKRQDSLGTSKGLGDLTFTAQYGLKLGERDGIRGLYSYGPEDSSGEYYTTDDLKIAFTGGITIPSGTISNDDDNGEVFDMGLQPGFGSTSFNFGFSASKMLFSHFTLTGDTSYNVFSQQNDGKPGNELRFNLAGDYEIFEDMGGFISRMDIIGEANLLHLTRDLEADRDQTNDSGGTILYLSPGFRATFSKRFSIGTLIKFPVWNDLNNESIQQGAEGLEDYRAVFTFTMSI